MDVDSSPGARIKILPPALAQKIAAGEVIERPQSVLRELLDNSIDAGSSTIEVRLTDGGLEEIVVIDDGMGMSAADLDCCFLPHATSKIRNESDLYDIRTLGFRGEALCSIAAVSHLDISSFDGKSGGKIIIDEGKVESKTGFSGKRGTRISVQRLFFNLPGRKQFLKRAATEFSMSRSVFVDKALAHPHISFRLFNGSELELFVDALDSADAQQQRYFQLFSQLAQNNSLLHTIRFSFQDGNGQTVLAGPSIFSNDRRNIQIFVNKRRVQDYALVQAVEYGYTGFLPGGRFPIAAVFLEVNPSRVDVNIHPAKREVRLKDAGAIHHSLSSAVQSFLRNASRTVHSPSTSTDFFKGHGANFEKQLNSDSVFESRTDYKPLSHNGTLGISVPKAPEQSADPTFAPIVSKILPKNIVPEEWIPTGDIDFLGQVFGVFLLFKISDLLYMMDMHAAHERIIFDRLVADAGKQQLLIPYEFTCDDDIADKRLKEQSPGLKNMGIELEYRRPTWVLSSVPRSCVNDVGTVVTWLRTMPEHREGIVRSLYATMSCRAAIKDGDHIDRDNALELIRKALVLPEKRCPHGRPIAFSLSKTELFELVGRIV